MDWHQFKIKKKFKNKKVRVLFSIFKFFQDNFGRPGIPPPVPPKQKKKSRLPPEERFLEPIQKKTLFQYIVGQAMFLKDCIYQRLRRTCIYGNQEVINNLMVDSS